MRYTSVNITTFLIFAATLGLIIARFRIRKDSNWPLFYYLFVVAYNQMLPGRLNPYAIYVGVICGMFQRFEFMSGAFRWIFTVVEMAVLLFLAYSFWNAIQ